MGALYDLQSFFFDSVIYAVIAGCAFVVYPLLLPISLSFYHNMHFLFRKSVEIYSSPTRTQARLLVSLTLNVSYWIVVYFALWQGVLRLVPLASVLEGVMPKSYEELATMYGVVVLILFFAGSAGPATIYVLTSFRHKYGEDTGRTTLILLELLCIFSSLYLLFSVFRYAADLSPIERFGRTFLIFVLPGTFANVAILRLFEQREGRRIAFFH
jgi:hypothetical protein